MGRGGGNRHAGLAAVAGRARKVWAPRAHTARNAASDDQRARRQRGADRGPSSGLGSGRSRHVGVPSQRCQLIARDAASPWPPLYRVFPYIRVPFDLDPGPDDQKFATCGLGPADRSRDARAHREQTRAIASSS